MKKMKSASRLVLAAIAGVAGGGLAVGACGDNTTVTSSDPGHGTISRDGASGTGDDGTAPGDDDSGTTQPPRDSSTADTRDAFVWPDCSAKPATATASAISDVWTASYATPTEVWISGAYVTGVSRGGCTANVACQIFLQTGLTYASLAAGAHQAIKMFVSAQAAVHLAGVAVGDKVDALGYAWRYTLDGQNELLVEVNLALPGCAKKTGTGTATPITGVSLGDLSVNGYEQTYGPLLVQLAGVSGTPTANLTETFGLFPTPDGGGGFDGGPDIVSLSPFFLPNAIFVQPPLVNGRNNFATLTGVFGLFVPAADAGPTTKYLEIYPRTSADIVVN